MASKISYLCLALRLSQITFIVGAELPLGAALLLDAAAACDFFLDLLVTVAVRSQVPLLDCADSLLLTLARYCPPICPRLKGPAADLEDSSTMLLCEIGRLGSPDVQQNSRMPQSPQCGSCTN